jgi:cardiolipin synthase
VVIQLHPIQEQWTTIFFVTVATSTVLSGADYVWIWIEKVISQEKK